MAVTRISTPNRYVGLSTDAKPTTDIPAGSRFTERDTGLTYVWDLTAWGVTSISARQNTWTAQQTYSANGIGVTPTDRVVLTNTTAAAAGAQQYSPAMHFHGSGWRTDATAAAQDVDARVYLVPVQGAANPSGYLTWEFAVNGGAYGEKLRLSSDGTLTVQGFRAPDGVLVAMTILNSGNVGINTTVPQSLLDVQGAAGAAGILTLATKELTVVDNDKLGRINFNAPLESDGGDAILVSASIWAEATITFSATANTTDLVFATGVSEAATEKMRLSSAGTLWVSSEADSTTAARGIMFGLSFDTNLYRSGANTLKTDDTLIVATALGVGVSGTSTGTIEFGGGTSGAVTLTVAAAAGTWTLTLPTGVAGVGGYQLADAAGNGVTSWTAAGSRREWKTDIADFADYRGALQQMLQSPLYTFRYKQGFGTGDYDTQYLGIIADESPWATHFNGSIINPVNTVGYMVAGFRAVHEAQESQEAKIIRLEARVAELEAVLTA